MAWNEIIHDRMAALLNDGYSAACTAEVLNDEFTQAFTRNAVIGRAHRAGLKFRRRPTTSVSRLPKGPRPRRYSRKIARQRRVARATPTVHPARAQALALVATEPTDLPADFSAFACTLWEIDEATSCRYPLGDPKTESFRFCGAGKLQDSPYCARHHLICYRPYEGRRSVPAASVATSQALMQAAE